MLLRRYSFLFNSHKLFCKKNGFLFSQANSYACDGYWLQIRLRKISLEWSLRIPRAISTVSLRKVWPIKSISSADHQLSMFVIPYSIAISLILFLHRNLNKTKISIISSDSGFLLWFISIHMHILDRARINKVIYMAWNWTETQLRTSRAVNNVITRMKQFHLKTVHASGPFCSGT